MRRAAQESSIGADERFARTRSRPAGPSPADSPTRHHAKCWHRHEAFPSTVRRLNSLATYTITARRSSGPPVHVPNQAIQHLAEVAHWLAEELNNLAVDATLRNQMSALCQEPCNRLRAVEIRDRCRAAARAGRSRRSEALFSRARRAELDARVYAQAIQSHGCLSQDVSSRHRRRLRL